MPDVLNELVAGLASGRFRVIDLAQPLGPDTPVIDLPPPFAPSPACSIEPISRYDEPGPAWYWNALSFGEHTGTHFDAPVHWITGRDLPDNACDTIPASRFIGPACVIDCSGAVRDDPDFLLEPGQIQRWEEEHGPIAPGSWLLMRTDWSKRIGAEAFLNTDDDGPHWPGFTREAVELLAHERDVLGVGVETVGTDAGRAGSFDPPFPAHQVMQGSGRFGLASLCRVDELPATGAVVIAAPLKIVHGSGSPVRALAIVPG